MLKTGNLVFKSMSRHSNHNFFTHIILPSILAVSLFVISIFAIIIPNIERNLMDGKRETIAQLTFTAWSVLKEYGQKATDGSLSLKEAQQKAVSIIETMRYGSERKDYFWIIDNRPFMIMHPYRPELNGTNLSDYRDTQGKALFREAVSLVERQNEGYIRYIWQWKDDATRMVPKLSYVKAFPDWGWIIGTGIYLEDVREEIKALKQRLTVISLFIALIITLALTFIIRQSSRIEADRKTAEENLRRSRQKYKSLVEASTEGTIMMRHNKIIFANLKFSEMLGRGPDEIDSMEIDDFFEVHWSDVISRFSNPNKSVTLETKLKCADNKRQEVIISVSKVDDDGDEAFIVVTKIVTRKKKLEKDAKELSRELQLSLLLMNRPIKPFIKELLSCPPDATVEEAAVLMTRTNRTALFIRLDDNIIGTLDESDFKTRVLARKLLPTTDVSEVMSSPVVSISQEALLYEALLRFKDSNVTNLLVKNTQGSPIGVLSHTDALDMQHNSIRFTIREIEAAENIESLIRINGRTPVLVHALMQSGDKAGNIMHIITSISDALTIRLIQLSIETLGKPPCDFAFLALGSEGRREQTLATDQDNAILFPDVAEAESKNVYRYFNTLAKEVSSGLDKAGYRYCKGNIMAKNPKWTQPLTQWKGYFTDWINKGDPQSILDSSIFFDLRCIFGASHLVEELMRHIHHQAAHKPVFFHQMAVPIIQFKPKVSVFGAIVGEQKTKEGKLVDIKKIQMYITSFARLYAIKNQVHETNTLKRLEKLRTMGVITEKLHNELAVSYSVLVQLRLRFQSIAKQDNQPADNMIDMNKLTEIETTTLKKIHSELGNLQTQVSFDFKGSA